MEYIKSLGKWVKLELVQHAQEVRNYKGDLIGLDLYLHGHKVEITDKTDAQTVLDKISK